MRIAKADLMPTEANLREEYRSFAELARRARSSASRSTPGSTARPAGPRLDGWTSSARDCTSCPPPRTPSRSASPGRWRDQTVRFGSVRYSTPPGLVGAEAWVRADGENSSSWWTCPGWPTGRNGQGGPAGPGRGRPARAVAAGGPLIDLAHYPNHPQDPDGSPRPPGPSPPPRRKKPSSRWAPAPKSWLIEAAAAGTTRIRAKMAAAVELAALVGAAEVDVALGLAATAGRFAEDDLLSIIGTRPPAPPARPVTVPDETHSVQPGTSAWAGFGTSPGTPA